MLDHTIQNNLEKIKASALVVDIETSALYSDGSEINIRTNFETYVANAKVKWVGFYSFKYNSGYYLNAQTDANQILKLLSEHDVLIGFNSEEFDIPILKNNGFMNEYKRYIQVDCMCIFGTSNFRNRKGYAYKNRGEIMGYKFKNNSLRCMAETMKLEHVKGDIDYKIFHKDVWTEEEILKIKKYLYSDIMSTKSMFEKLYYYWMPFAELLDEKYIYDLSWIKSSIASLTYKAACRIINTEPTYSDKQVKEEKMGGNVFDPQIEEAYGVWCVDFGSLYPHMFTMFNLPAEIPEEKIDACKKVWHGNDVFQVRGYYDVSKWHLLSEYIFSKLKERMYLKKHDKDNPLVYTLKIFLNGLYGIFRSPLFEKIHTPNCGWDCCWLGQQIQQLTKEMVEQFGFTIIYGDTDSIFFMTDNKEINTREYVQDCLNQIIDVIKDNVPFPVDTFNITIEHYLEYIMFPFEESPVIGEDGKNKKIKNRLVLERKGKKKNYAYIYKDEEGTQVKLVGLPIKKDNATHLGIKIYEEILKPEIIKNTRAKFSKSFLEATIQEYLQKPEIMDLISIEYKVNAFSSYKSNCIQAQISQAYFDGNEGVIRLIKNTKIGKVGKGDKYCTIAEAKTAKLTITELDLEKLWKELTPFILCEDLIKSEDEETLIINTEVTEPIEIKEDTQLKKKRGRPRKVDKT